LAAEQTERDAKRRAKAELSVLTARQRSDFRCTLIIGFTQTKQWFEAEGGFCSVATPGRWQFLYVNGGGVDKWRDPTYEGWQEPIVSHGDTSGLEPDRVVLTISGPYGDDEEAWVEAIAESIVAIWERVPTARQIVLQPIVGGPSGSVCEGADGRRVRAAWQHLHIDNAIAMVASGDVVAGLSPEVRDCADFANETGHLTAEGAAEVGRAIAMYYETSVRDL
jgi:hypothetical protein